MMSKIKLRKGSEVCADCGALGPGWASINRGVLICDECCCIHRSLGKHISHVKSLRNVHWSPSQLEMVRTLYSAGSNSIWEHVLLDPGNAKCGRRKPQPQDPIHRTKEDFIRAKYVQLSFVCRPSREDGAVEESDLSQQLHSSVRTTNLETSLRLLSQGADPKYFHPDKGTTPLHVAAQAGQPLQVELLLAYGADPNAEDKNGRTPAYYARNAGHRDLAERIIETLYEVTDRFTFFLCNRRPDHVNGNHYLIPEMVTAVESADGRLRLHQLPNPLFEELATDVYDEIDRRETEAVWLTVPSAIQNSGVPFLPVNPEFSATRNQGRQKLARFSPAEFNALIRDLLISARKRQSMESQMVPGNLLALQRQSQLSDDDPLYDSVASDDDYASTDQIMRSIRTSESKDGGMASGSDPTTPGSGADKVEESSLVEQDLRRKLAESELLVDDLKTRLAASEAAVEELRAEMLSSRAMIQQLEAENRELKQQILPNGHDVEKSSPTSTQRPTSMFEPREGIRPAPRVAAKSQVYPSKSAGVPPAGIMMHTSHVTERIKELVALIRDPSKTVFVPCAEKITEAVNDLTSTISQDITDEKGREVLQQLWQDTNTLLSECTDLQNETTLRPERNIFVERVRCTAYDIAKAVKWLVSNHVLLQSPKKCSECRRKQQECLRSLLPSEIHYIAANRKKKSPETNSSLVLPSSRVQTS